MKKQLIIIGGGASGLMAGITAAREGAEVTILEHMERVGKKILSTGNGRCNMTNLSLRAEHYRCTQKQFPMKVLDRFSVWDTLAFFDEIGIVTKNKNGYIYPNSEQASAVLDTLRMEAERLGIAIRLSCQVKSIRKKGRQEFFVDTDQGMVCGNRLILATGSKAAPVTGSDGSGYDLAKRLGHTVITPLPALVQLRCEGNYYKQLAGIRCEAVIKLLCDGRTLAADQGEVQLTDYGISGIPTFQVSRFASVALAEGKAVTAELDFLPSKSMEDTRLFLKKRAAAMPERMAGDFLVGVLNRKLAGVLLKLSGIALDQPVRDIAKPSLEKLTMKLKQFQTRVIATNSFEQAQVCCGGVDTREIRPETMESRVVPGLYLVGELLDVDGVCGGYNLQWAWSTGAVAGRSAGRDEG
ncbi:MAG: NAD(P)/FAD-dependent oxidoreductase [Lachnospiraceae bacterium]|nr:NAD(P)/FAD-dependent oxidoreductase [Lachnospiraceae bacterium]